MKVEVTKDQSGLWRVRNAPVIATGIEYPLLTGKTTFTEEQLFDSIKALDDPAIVAPRIKLGHTSDYNLALVGDAEMAFGRMDGKSLHLSNNGQTIFGDYLVPEWLGTVMPIAFPNRSIEGAFDVETATGKRYTMVISAVALLGIYWPGCQVLEDLPLWYGGDIPDGVEFDDAIAAQLAASQEIAAKGGKVRLGRHKEVQADADTSRIRRQFYERAMSGELDVEGDTYWWWIRGERVSDNGSLYLIVEDDENGDLYKFDVSVSGSDVEIATPTPVEIQYVEKTAASLGAVVAGMATLDDGLVVHASAADTGGPVKSTQERSVQMDDATRKRLAASLGLADTATEADINAKLQRNALKAANPGSGAEGGEPDSAGLPGSEVNPEDEPPAHQTPPGTAPSGTGNPSPAGVVSTEDEEQEDDEEPDNEDPDAEAGKPVVLDRATFNRLKAGAEAALKTEAAAKKNRQANKVAEAIKAGKFPRARRDHYLKLMAADEVGTTQLIDSLEAGTIPVHEIGNGGGGSEDGGDISASQGAGLPDEWFPDIAQRRAANQAGPKPVTAAREG